MTIICEANALATDDASGGFAAPWCWKCGKDLVDTGTGFCKDGLLDAPYPTSSSVAHLDSSSILHVLLISHRHPRPCRLARTAGTREGHFVQDCEHDFTGPMVEFNDTGGGGGGSVSCKKCGMLAINHDYRVGP